MIIRAERGPGGAVIVTAQDVRDAGRFEIAMQSRRQPEGQQHQGGESADVSHVETERRVAAVVNPTGDLQLAHLLGAPGSSPASGRGDAELEFGAPTASHSSLARINRAVSISPP